MLVLLVCAFALTRLAGAWLADHPQTYREDVTGDVATYELKARAIVEGGWAPYSNVPVEYPPGSLPFIIGPATVLDDISFRVKFIVLMLAADILGFIGLIRLAKRWGSTLGCWLWVALVPLLGPIVYLRLDLVPAMATIWLLERAAASNAIQTGAWLSFGVIAKLYPIFFFLPAVRETRHRRLLVIGAAAMFVPLLALGTNLDDVYRTVFGYHATRSIQVESTWATPFLVAMRRGYDAVIRLNFGAFHIEGGLAPTVKTLASIVSLIAVALMTVLALRRIPRGNARTLAAACFAILVVSISTGLVFSPQFLIWVFALAGVTLADPDSPMKLACALLIPVTALTQWVYPFLYDPVLEVQSLGVAVLSLRNLLMVALAAIAVAQLARLSRVNAFEREEAASTPPAAPTP